MTSKTIDIGPGHKNIPGPSRSSHGAKISEKRAIPVTRDPPIENPPNLAPSPTTNRQTDFHPYQVHSTPPPLCPVDKTNPVSRKTPFPWSKTHQTWHRDSRQTDRPPAQILPAISADHPLLIGIEILTFGWVSITKLDNW